MFTKRRARKQAELHEELAAALRDPDAEVRRRASRSAAESGELRWALRELAQAVEREPWTEDFSETVVDGFAAALRRDQTVRERTERIFTLHRDDPEGFVRAWTELTAELGGAPAVREVSGDLRDDMRSRLTYLRDEGRAIEGPSDAGRPLTFARELAFDITVLVASLVMLRNTPLAEEEADRARAEMRAALKKALPHAPGSAERAAHLAPLTRTPKVESWTDRARMGLYADEALALCASEERELETLGTQALARLLFHDVVRRDQVRGALDRLVARGAADDSFLLGRILTCYSHLHVPIPLDDPPLGLFLDGLRHPDPVVRASAADGLDPLATDSPEEGRAVEGLVGLLENDPETVVRRSAATALRWLRYGDRRHADIAAEALAGQAGSPDAELRAHSVADALRRGAPDAYDRLLTALEAPDAHWQLLSGLLNVPGDSGFVLPSRAQRKALIARLEALRATGWAERDSDAGDPGAAFPGVDFPGFDFPSAESPGVDERAELLGALLETLRDA